MPPGQKIMYITWDLLFSERYAVRKPDIYKVWTADPSCLCIFRYVKLRVYKRLLKKKLWGFCTSLTSLMSILSLFLPLTPSRFQADLWKTEALCVHFSAQASKTHARGSSRWGTLCYSYVFLGEISVETFCSLLNWIVCLFLWSSKSSLYILDTSPLSGRYMICKYSFPFCGLSFYFFHGVP